MGQSVPELIIAFREAAVNYGQALDRGAHQSANKSSRRGNELKRELVRSGPLALQSLLYLLGDSDPWVRYATAASTLDIEPEQSHRILTELQSQPRALGAAAYATLRLSESGTPRA